MKLPGVIILIAFLSSSGLSRRSLPSLSEAEGIVRNSALSSRNRKCRINVCFAIDGSGSIGASAFSLQKGLTFDLIAWLPVIDDRFSIAFGAVQYGNKSCEISRVSADIDTVFKAVNDARPKGGFSSIAAGIDRCSYLLAHSKAGLPVVALMGDGKNNFGYDPVQAGNMFRRQHRNGEIYGVGVGSANKSALQAITANEKVFTAHDHLELSKVIFSSEPVACQLD